MVQYTGEGGALKISKCIYVVLKGQRRSQSYILQGSTESLDINLQKLSTQVEFEFGTVLLNFGLGSMLRNTSQSSLKSWIMLLCHHHLQDHNIKLLKIDP